MIGVILRLLRVLNSAKEVSAPPRLCVRPTTRHTKLTQSRRDGEEEAGQNEESPSGFCWGFDAVGPPQTELARCGGFARCVHHAEAMLSIGPAGEIRRLPNTSFWA